MWSTDGSVVEFSPATREARVRFPVSAFLLHFFICINYVGRKLFADRFLPTLSYIMQIKLSCAYTYKHSYFGGCSSTVDQEKLWRL